MKRRAAPAAPVVRDAATAADAEAPAAGWPWPAWRDLLRPTEPWLVPLLILFATRAYLWRRLPYASEDAYITYRYAWNFAHGFGLAYNPGERVMGFSSPLWTLWSAVGIKLGLDPALWSRSWALAADVVTLLTLGALLRRHVSRAAAWTWTCFFAAWPYFAAVTLSGMENGPMLCLIALGAAAVGARSIAAGPLLGALALIRPEGLVAAAVLGLGARWRDRLVALGILALGLGALYAVFGTIVPQSVVAKSVIYGTPGPWVGRQWWIWLSPFPLGGAPTLIEGVHLFLLTVVLSPAIVVALPIAWRLRATALGLAIGAGLAIWLGYCALGVAYFWWYFVVPLGALTVLAAIGFPRIVRGPAIVVSAALFVAGMWTVAPNLYVGRAQAELYGFGEVSNYLTRNCRPGEKIMLEPIGMIGYRNPLIVVDEVGLVSPAVARRRLQGAGWYTDVVAEERPDWLVVRRGVLRSGAAFAGKGVPFRDAAERDSLLARHHVVAVMDSTAGDMALVILRRDR